MSENGSMKKKFEQKKLMRFEVHRFINKIKLTRGLLEIRHSYLFDKIPIFKFTHLNDRKVLIDKINLYINREEF